MNRPGPVSRTRSGAPPHTRRPTEFGRVLLAGSGWLTLAGQALPVGTPLRAAMAFGFLLSCPGAALMRHWPGQDRLEQLVVAVAASVALTILVSESLLVAGAWSVTVAVIVLSGLTSAAALAPASTDRRRR